MSDLNPNPFPENSLVPTPQQPPETSIDFAEQEILRRAEQFQDNFEEPESNEEPVRAVNPIKIVLRTLRDRYWIAAGLACLLAALGATGGYLSKHPIYVSGGIIQVYPTKTNILYSDQDDSRLRLFDAFVAAEASFLKSPPVLERAVKSTRMADLDWPTDLDGMNRLKEAVAVEKKGGLITVTTGYRDPVAAATILNVVLDSYQELNSERMKMQDSVRDRELSSREQDIMKSLSEVDQKILKVGQEYGTTTIAAAHIRKITESEDIDKRIGELGIRIATMSGIKPKVSADVGHDELKRTIVLDQALAAMLFERSKQLAEMAVLEARHAPEHRDIIEMRARIKVIDQSIEDRRNSLATLASTGPMAKGGAKDAPESLEELKELQTRFIAERKSLQQEAKALNERMVELEFLKDERTQLRSRLEEIRRGLEQIRLESNHTLPGTVEIKSRGVVSTHPATDKRMMFCLAGGGFGAVGGFALTLAYGLLFGCYRYSDDLSEGQPNIPMLGALPAVTRVSPELDPLFQKSIYRLGVDLQLLMDTTPGGKILAVTGTSGGSGTSTVALALARAFTKSHLNTILVDADFTDGTLTGILGLNDNAGLRECLKEGLVNTRLIECQSTSLRALPLGKSDGHSDSHIARRRFAHLLQQLRSQCDLVIVDLGPLTDRLVARMGSAIADRVMFVVPAGAKVASVNPSLADLERLAPNRNMTVLNFASRKDPRIQAA